MTIDISRVPASHGYTGFRANHRHRLEDTRECRGFDYTRAARDDT